MMRKDVSAGGEIQVQNIRKNDEKIRFKRWRRPSSRNPKKMMRKDVSGDGFQKFRKNYDEKRRFRIWISKIPKK